MIIFQSGGMFGDEQEQDEQTHLWKERRRMLICRLFSKEEIQKAKKPEKRAQLGRIYKTKIIVNISECARSKLYRKKSPFGYISTYVSKF